jgi:pentatricopeptide repeat protein
MQSMVAYYYGSEMSYPLLPHKWKKIVVLFGSFSPLHTATRKSTINPSTATAFPRDANGNDLRTLCKQGQLKEALRILHSMGNRAGGSTYVCLLQGCFRKKALSEGRLVHIHMKQNGFNPDKVLQNTLVNMYAKCGSFVDARRVFDQMPERDVFSWSVMISAYAKYGHAREALGLFHRMQQAGIKPNEFTFSSILPACAKLADLEKGVEIHEEIIRCGFESDVFVANALTDMYAKCGNTEKARELFDKMGQRNVVSWNSMIAGYAQNGLAREALEVFEKMQIEGMKPNSNTFASVLPAYASLRALEQGSGIHQEILRSGFQFDVFVGSALVDMYVKCGSLEKARDVFDKMTQRNTVSWTAMILGYAQNGQNIEAMKLFRQMRLAGVKPDSKTFASVLPACASLAALEEGMEIHEEVVRSKQCDAFVEIALIDMYAKCQSIEKARDLFDKMPQRNVISWTAMIAGYAYNGQALEALKLFQEMKLAGVKPDAKTFASVLPACASMVALDQGIEIHEEIVTRGFQSDVFLEGALVDMYAKCGNIKKAREIFDDMHKRDVTSWTAMIGGYAMHGYGQEALKLFEQMQHSGIKPNHITLICVLTACCHVGLVKKGKEYFDSMSQYYKITPVMEHYGCMVDLLARAGYLDEAEDFISKMPIKPDASVWCCLLGACRTRNNVELGERAAERIFELEPTNAAPYVLLSNIYASAGRWDDIERVRKMMKEKGVMKRPGCSSIEVNKRLHAFTAGGSHPQMNKIYAKLETLSMQIKAAGYVPNTRFVLNDVEEEQKEQFLYNHSEKLAIAFGLINTNPGDVIRVIKNLRVCGDCHSAIKFISKVFTRVIIVRDTSRYHHFKDGLCSCGDYW